MAFLSADMVLMAHGNNVKSLKYESTADTLATIEAADYFDSFGDQVRVGDVLMVKGTDGSRMYTFTTAGSTDVAITAYEGQNPVFAHSLSTSISVQADGVVTFSPSTVLTGDYQIGSPPYPGRKLTLIDLGSSTSIAIRLVGSTTSTVGFGKDTAKSLTIENGGRIDLMGHSALIWGHQSGVVSAASSLTGDTKEIRTS